MKLFEVIISHDGTKCLTEMEGEYKKSEDLRKDMQNNPAKFLDPLSPEVKHNYALIKLGTIFTIKETTVTKVVVVKPDENKEKNNVT